LEASSKTARLQIACSSSRTASSGARRRRSGGPVGDRIVVAGGIAGGKHVGPVEIFDGERWRDGAAMPSPLDHVSAATDGSFVYVAGGRRGGKHFATFQRYDVENDRWDSLSNMPTPRSGTGAAFVNGMIVVAGGEGPRMFPEVEAYDIPTGRWSRLPDLAVPVHGVGVVAVGSNVYAFVGGTEVGLAPTRACQVLAIE
jgi:non-specific serine/threonine protein kinase